MTVQKTKAIHNLEEKMGELAPESYRYKVLECARDFKSSWIQLGQYLFTAYKDKLYKDWGYLTFEAYCSKEVGIRQMTAMKLLKSYSFLEREEPAFLKKETREDRKPNQIPSYEAVNALRLAKESEKLSERQYENLREDIFDNAKEDKEVKQKIRYILKSNTKTSPEEEKEDKKAAVVKRVLTNLNHAKNDLAELGFPGKIMKQVDTLIELLAEYK